MNKELYAFWKYDQFPYVCGGTVTNLRSDGAVETVGFGKGYWFMPIKILPVKEGREIAKKLRVLGSEYQAAQTKLSKDFLDKRNQIITL